MVSQAKGDPKSTFEPSNKSRPRALIRVLPAFRRWASLNDASGLKTSTGFEAAATDVTSVSDAPCRHWSAPWLPHTVFLNPA